MLRATGLLMVAQVIEMSAHIDREKILTTLGFETTTLDLKRFLRFRSLRRLSIGVTVFL